MGKDYLLNHIKDQVSNHKVNIDKDALWTNLQPALAANTATAVSTPAWLQFILNGGFVVFFFTTAMIISGFEADKSVADVESSIDIHTELKDNSAVANLTIPTQSTVKGTDTNPVTVEQTLVAQSDELSSSKKAPFIKTNTISRTSSSINKSTIQANPTSDRASNTNTEVSPSGISPNTSFNGAGSLASTSTYNKQIIDNKLSKGLSLSTYKAPSAINLLNPLKKDFVYNSIESSQKRKFSFGTTDCPTFGNKGPNPWSIFAYTGPNMTFRNLSSANNENEAYLNQREETESALESLRSGLGIKYSFRNGIYVKAGIEHLRINEKLNTTATRDTSYVLEDQIIQVIVHSVGDTTFVRGDLPITERITQNWEVYSKYTALSFPISVGYEVLSGRWSYFGEAGVVINTRFNFSGYITDAAGTPVQDPDIFKSRVGMGLHLTAGLGYNITPRIKLTASPSFFKNLDAVNNQANLIDQEYSTLGLLVGAEYKF